MARRSVQKGRKKDPAPKRLRKVTGIGYLYSKMNGTRHTTDLPQRVANVAIALWRNTDWTRDEAISKASELLDFPMVPGSLVWSRVVREVVRNCNARTWSKQ